MNDDEKLFLAFSENTKHTENVGSYIIECRKGLWSVESPTREEAIREALHYFIQYCGDGEYEIVSPKDCKENNEEGSSNIILAR